MVMSNISKKSSTRSRALNEKDYAALAAFRHSLRRFLAFSEEAARQAGLTPQQHQALLAVRGLGSEKGLTVGELAERLLLKHHTTVGLVDRLVRANLLRRMPDKEDRRRALLSLTPKANRALKALSAIHLAEIRRNAPRLVALLRKLSAMA
jgi:DNA-binding MarR family transcriptional regulator